MQFFVPKKIWSGSDVVAGQAADADANAYIEAAQGLYRHMQKGTYKHQFGKQLPLKGDVSKLLYAHGITQEQNQLLRNIQFVGSQISGVQGTRIHIGRCMFGGNPSTDCHFS